VDTAGLRRKARVQEKLEKLSTQDSIRAITFAEVVLLIMDATHPFEIQDLQIADLVEREGRGLVYVLAKWDLVEDPQARLKEFVEEADRVLPQLRGTPVVALSAETGRGLDRLMPAVLKVHNDWSTKIKTRDLNDWLALAVQRHPPPAINGRRIKPKYMAQTKARPPTFVLFASRAAELPESYRRYLINSLRESFDMPGVPLRVSIKQNSNPFVDGEPGDEPKRQSLRPPKAKTQAKALAKSWANTAKAKKAGVTRPGMKKKSDNAKPGFAKTRAAKAGSAKLGAARSGPARAKPSPGRRPTR
jgi:GTP-binding protein